MAIYQGCLDLGMGRVGVRFIHAPIHKLLQEDFIDVRKDYAVKY